MLTYSIAIRTLGTAGDKFRKELESIRLQTVLPERVMVYIAEGYPRPDFTVGQEEYVWVRKGMVAQRALPYDEITSDVILMLDDDVLLSPDSAGKLLKALEDNDLDCVGADVFKNHLMPFAVKLKAALSNWVFPHHGEWWAFRMHRTGSFSYNGRPEPRCYRSQTCGGPAMMWRKEAFLGLRYSDELWMDGFGFAYGDDALLSYKLHLNGGRLGVLYDSGVENLDAGSSSASFKRSAGRMYVIAKAPLMIWWRSIYRNGADNRKSRFLARLAFCPKVLWQSAAMLLYSLARLSPRLAISYFRGIRDGIRSARRDPFKSLPVYASPGKK